jgi:N-dimethylarginine dimethylaminohydrolase
VNLLYQGSALTDSASLRQFLADAAPRPRFGRVLMVDPTHFQVLHVLNPHMEGNLGSVDADRAHDEWSAIRDTYESLGFPVTVVHGTDAFPDLVFVANQILPYVDGNGEPALVLSHMAKPERQGEVPYLTESLGNLGMRSHPLRTILPLEGTGDAVWHPGKNLIWGGHGFRTSEDAWAEVAELTGAVVVPLSLVEPRMYHLDVALMPIDERTAFSYRGAFDGESWARLAAGFERLIEVDAEEALHGFALNGHCPDGKNLLLPAGNPHTRAEAELLGLRVHELSTSEFQKAGGSIFCLKNVLP